MRLIDADKLCEDLLERWSIADTRKEELIRLVTPIIASQPSVPLYTPDELQTMQNLEWSQMKKMYELGKEEALQRTQMSVTEPFKEESNAEWRKKHYEISYNQGFIDACKYYENLPERKKGKWLNRRIVYMDVHIATCDQCGKRVVVGNFCHNCGCQMNGGVQE